MAPSPTPADSARTSRTIDPSHADRRKGRPTSITPPTANPAGPTNLYPIHPAPELNANVPRITDTGHSEPVATTGTINPSRTNSNIGRSDQRGSRSRVTAPGRLSSTATKHDATTRAHPSRRLLPPPKRTTLTDATAARAIHTTQDGANNLVPPNPAVQNTRRCHRFPTVHSYVSLR